MLNYARCRTRCFTFVSLLLRKPFMMHPVSMFKYVMFDITLTSSSMSRLPGMNNWILLFLSFVNVVYVYLLKRSVVLSGRKCLTFTAVKHHTWTLEWYNITEDKPMYQLHCSDEIIYTSYRQYTQQKHLEVFSNNSLVHYCISHCSPCLCLHKWHLT